MMHTNDTQAADGPTDMGSVWTELETILIITMLSISALLCLICAACCLGARLVLPSGGGDTGHRRRRVAYYVPAARYDLAAAHRRRRLLTAGSCASAPTADSVYVLPATRRPHAYTVSDLDEFDCARAPVSPRGRRTPSPPSYEQVHRSRTASGEWRRRPAGGQLPSYEQALRHKKLSVQSMAAGGLPTVYEESANVRSDERVL